EYEAIVVHSAHVVAFMHAVISVFMSFFGGCITGNGKTQGGGREQHQDFFHVRIYWRLKTNKPRPKLVQLLPGFVFKYQKLIPVRIRFERTLNTYTDIIGLLSAEYFQFHTDFGEVE